MQSVYRRSFGLAATYLAPVLVFAGQAEADFGYLTGLAQSMRQLVATLIPVVIAIGLLLFVWGVVQFIANAGDDSARDEGKKKMIWGVIALFVIVAVWGLVALIGQITGVETDATPFEDLGIPN